MFDISESDRQGHALETALESLGASCRVTDVREGPVLTLYDVEPTQGVRASKVAGLASDVAMALRAADCRAVQAPERGVVTFEVTRRPDQREPVSMAEVRHETAGDLINMRLPIVIGRGVCGTPQSIDLVDTPHLLVAGSTGSGKSVFLRSMILSLVDSCTPAECRLLLVDPKRLEFAEFEGLKHLVTKPVVDPHDAVLALRMAVKEMQNRYEAMAKTGARTLDEHNAIVREKSPDLVLPRLVVVVDEYADLMVMAGKQVEHAVRRITQVARAAGIHLVLATQRPSVDVVTGVVKANLPSRLCFRVTSRTDSRVILDTPGAEKLLGKGDAYWFQSGDIRRVHCAFPDIKLQEGIRRVA